MSIQNASRVIGNKLIDAAYNHKQRQLAIRQNFLNTLRNSTISLGCNSTCYDVCSRYVGSRYFSNCLSSSYCNSCLKNTVWFTPGNSTLNTFQIVEAEYGNVNELSYEDFKCISQSLIQVRANS